MKRKYTRRIPPDQESHDLKVTKVNYQVYTLRHYHEPDVPASPTNYGWVIGWRISGGWCTPIRYTQSALPQSLNDAVEQRRGAMITHTNDDSSDPDESIEDTDSEEDV